MIIDCEQCSMRNLACSDCVVSHLLVEMAPASHPQHDLAAAEERALRVLHGSGLVPPLRLTVAGEGAAATA